MKTLTQTQTIQPPQLCRPDVSINIAQSCSLPSVEQSPKAPSPHRHRANGGREIKELTARIAALRKNRAVADYAAARETVSVIAGRYGISASLLTMWAKEAGVQMRGCGKPPMAEPHRHQKLILSLIGTVPLRELAAAAGCAHQHIHQLAKRWPEWVGPKTTPRTSDREDVNSKRPPRVHRKHVVSFRLTDAQLASLKATGGGLSPTKRAREIVLAVLGDRDSLPDMAA